MTENNEFRPEDNERLHTDDVQHTEGDERTPSDRFAEDMRKFAEQSTYAAKGFAGFVSERAREFYDDQRAKYHAEHPGADKEPGAKEFLEQLRIKLNEFVESLTKGFNDMADRGRGEQAAKADGVVDQDVVAEDDVVVEDTVAQDAAVTDEVNTEQQNG